MLKLQFINASVRDDGYGLSVNGRDLAAIISTALGTRVGDLHGYNSGLPSFKSNCCNVTITIDPQPITEYIETDEEIWNAVDDLEDDKSEQYQEKAETE